ncbi:cystinosin homolog isoform X2 [Amborella trichopoda]|uniref:cystinosin homolog isoform X2 n=1 Tax=Amborella trichopoda TaxID=13333 RepID=UPI0009BD4437|nr:cystinosin homolog isoform X2 [Amborella trichopoda]|eukprot:XP_020527561.1 cystinosin homolog isoform X2 [Amborella trichopoda]
MASWNSLPLEVVYQVLGWIAFVSWSISFYPQVFLNYRRKSSFIQRQYRQKYGSGEMIPVAANDVAFSIHAVILTAFTIVQVFIYERGSQKVSKIAWLITVAVWAFAAVCFFIALPKQSWLWCISMFNFIQVSMTAIKYIPQVIMNFRRKSTEGWSIGNILLDLLGGITNFGQMSIQSIDQRILVNFYGNIGKTLLSLEVVFFDLLFIIQHYVLYPAVDRKCSIAATSLKSTESSNTEANANDDSTSHTV